MQTAEHAKSKQRQAHNLHEVGGLGDPLLEVAEEVAKRRNDVGRHLAVDQPVSFSRNKI